MITISIQVRIYNLVNFSVQSVSGFGIGGNVFCNNVIKLLLLIIK